MDFLGIGPGELVLVLVVALMIFGPGKLPEFARGLGRAVREFRKYSSALTRDFREEFEKEIKAAAEVPKEGTSESKRQEKQPADAPAPAAGTPNQSEKT
ncbi:MAG: twin-arginine translocase TatA/TatE family subunit [Chloroflexota bacterium]